MMRVAVLGVGLVGGSIGLALRTRGIEVAGYDADAERTKRALTIGAIDESAESVLGAITGADVVVVAVPVGSIAALVIEALDCGATVVTDVGSVKASIVSGVEAARPDLINRFVPGHPMAGSEQDGLDGANVDLFTGAVWVLTPTAMTSSDAYSAVRSLVSALGAEIVEVSPDQHDMLVAVVSHVPQLAATTLMDVATKVGDHQATMLRLAAGGFRDMTRIASGHPGIWPDICVANRDAILLALDDYMAALGNVRSLVAEGEGEALLAVLERARSARQSLPTGREDLGPLVEVRVPVLDRPGVIAEVTTMASRLGVNILDVEIAHSLEGGQGVLVLIIPESGFATFDAALSEAGYHVARGAL
ncbi:MAG: prephenate dehydrogenase/arogenate dehydrogenase family protein [Acidimicrobiia bacterium]|nr:prephenate dehydrogenase/arogenate dehydrogenase family protein [Acidimicrobiia bacterium]